jgi:putative ABC transport system permease protein
LVQPASRIAWRFAVAGPDKQVATYMQWAQDQVGQAEVRGVRLPTRAEPPTRLRPSTFGHADAAIVASAAAALTVALLIGAIVGA